MVATVLVGRSATGPGVTAKIFNLRDAGASQADSDTLRHKAVNEWALLNGAVVPTTPSEMIIKLSRHAIAKDQVWTWIACYGTARFPDNERGGTYIGCGVLERDEFLDATRTLQYVIDIQVALDALKNRG